jgi:hypothetical protein
VFVDYDHGNWCEGLTTYLADYAYKEDEDPGAARDYRLGRLQGYLDYASSGGRDFPLSRFTERESAATQAVGYGKTMMVFHMVRGLLGEAHFRNGLRRFYADNRFREAAWSDIVRSFEQVSGRVLGGWFDQWTERAGVPVKFAVDGEVRTRTVTLSGASATATIDGPASWVAVDPDFEVFRLLHREEVSPALSEILGADSTVVVIGSRCEPGIAAALRNLAAGWSANQNQIMVEEAAFTGADGRGVWLFGEGDLVETLFRNTQAFGERPGELRDQSRNETRSLIAGFRDPDGRDLPWTVLLPQNAAVVPALGRKLPHYGSYSYLVFSDEDNVAKGRWSVETSPLRRDLDRE